MRRRGPVVAVAIIILSVVFVRGQIPAPADGQSVESRTQVRRLGNGLTVIVSEKHGSSTFGGTLTCLAGYAFDPPGGSGTAHLTEHLLRDFTVASVGAPPELHRQLREAYTNRADVQALEAQVAKLKDRGQWNIMTISDTSSTG